MHIFLGHAPRVLRRVYSSLNSPNSFNRWRKTPARTFTRIRRVTADMTVRNVFDAGRWPFRGGGKDSSSPAALVVTSRKRLLHGEFVKKIPACVLFILLGQTLFAPAVARADTNSAQPKPRNSMKKYMKQQKKEQRKAQKLQKRAVKNWKKQHQAGRS
jgi:hypothetical protein